MVGVNSSYPSHQTGPLDHVCNISAIWTTQLAQNERPKRWNEPVFYPIKCFRLQTGNDGRMDEFRLFICVAYNPLHGRGIISYLFSLDSLLEYCHFVTISDWKWQSKCCKDMFLKDDDRAEVKRSISPGDQYTPEWVNRRQTHTQNFPSFQRGNVHSINIWSLLIERICAA